MNSKMLKLWESSLYKYSRGVRTFKDVMAQHRNTTIALWRSYNGERSSLGRTPVTDVRIVAPYLLGFHLSNLSRVIGLLERAQLRGLKISSNTQKVQVIDLGCGTGAATLGLIEQLKLQSLELKIELIDRSRHLLKCAEEQISQLAPKCKVRTLQREITEPQALQLHSKWQAQKVDLSVLMISYVWNELAAHPRKRALLYEALMSWVRCEHPTWIVVTEPSNEESAQSTLQLRNYLCEDGWQIVYPCPSSKPCPMGNGQRDWCYSEFAYESPKIVQPIEKMLGVSRTRLGSSAYVFVNPAYKEKWKSGEVVVGHPLQGTQRQLLVCDGEKLRKQKDQPELMRGQDLSFLTKNTL